MKLGLENRNKTIAVIVLVLVAAIVIAWELWPSSTTSASVAASPAARPTSNTSGKKGSAATLSTLDPTLRYEWLKASEETKYEGNGKNIFVAAVEPIPQPIAPAALPQPAQPVADPGPPPPPPIPLKFYGFASSHAGSKQVFLSEGEDIFIAKEGDIVDRRYRVIRILPMAVEIEDVLNNNRQQIPLTQG